MYSQQYYCAPPPEPGCYPSERDMGMCYPQYEGCYDPCDPCADIYDASCHMSVEERNMREMARLRSKLGLPQMTCVAGRSHSEYDKVSPENAARIREIRDRLGIPMMKSMDGQLDTRATEGDDDVTYTSPEDMGAAMFNQHGAPHAERPFLQPQPVVVQPPVQTVYRPPTQPTLYYQPAIKPNTEWEKWDAKEASNPGAVTAEQLGANSAYNSSIKKQQLLQQQYPTVNKSNSYY
eukprot:TRINITY_DN17240_c0_g1_i1.p1 TRINITY_DN17240_c0_g1~~TRINITY_DN17240_c0_g1_i1.p1  ORF type:complete len:248 (+),score=47.98 TRINITY_DN17240_c0_g1_i1:42-746(+)